MPFRTSKHELIVRERIFLGASGTRGRQPNAFRADYFEHSVFTSDITRAKFFAGLDSRRNIDVSI
jgi:hypothetical protein